MMEASRGLRFTYDKVEYVVVDIERSNRGIELFAKPLLALKCEANELNDILNAHEADRRADS